MTVEKKWRLDSKSGTCGGDNMSTERQSKGERLMSEHAGRGSWCNAEGIAMETNGGKEQTRRRRRGLNRKEEITASYCGVFTRGEGPVDKRVTSVEMELNE